jgi:hypothetical protein
LEHTIKKAKGKSKPRRKPLLQNFSDKGASAYFPSPMACAFCIERAVQVEFSWPIDNAGRMDYIALSLFKFFAEL